MKPSRKRLLAMTLLVLSGTGLGWLAFRPAPPLPRQKAANEATLSRVPGMPAPAPVHHGIPSAQAENKQVRLEAPREKQDRFAGRAVVAEKEEVQIVAGVKQVKRVRLVRDPSFKYPLIRVEDELVRGPQGDRLTRQVAMVADHVLVKMATPQISEADLLSQLKDEGASLRKKMPSSGTWLVAFENPDLDTVPRLVAKLGQLKNIVRYAEPDYIMSVNALPNDTSFGTLWGMHNTGQTSGVEDADIDAPEAWALNTGSKAVKVAVIDTGIDLDHPDLKANLWTNPNETKNGIDDDHNGYVDDLQGWDFVNDDAAPADDNGHGTHCSGTIGAVGNNAAGVVGVCWNTSLIALKILNASGNGTLSDAEEAIYYSTSLGVTLTSNSWSGDEFSQSLKEAIDAAGNAGILFIAAAGNSGSYTEFYPEYPGAYESTNLISVAATTRQDTLADFSNYGPVSTDLAAPGQDIYSTVPGGGYGNNSGTSMACPHVTGACALLKSFRPALTAPQIRELILKSVDVIPALQNKTATGGRLNVFNALLASDDVLVTPGNGFVASGALGGPFTPVSKSYTITNYTTQTVAWTAAADQTWITLTPAGGSLSAGESINLTVALNAEASNTLQAGTQMATVTVTNATSGRSQLRPVTVQVNSLPVYEFDLNSDPGWPRTGEWAFGVPLGKGGDLYGRSDPRTGATGDHVFGINLAGDYATNIGQPQYLTAGPFDLSAHRNTKLRYQRWLNADFQTWVYALVQVSNDGSTWHTVWSNDTLPYSDAAWTATDHDISAYADGQPQVYVRWVHQVANLGSYPYSGWNLDDIQILGTPKQQMTLVLPDSVTEGGYPQQARLRLSPAPASPLAVTLTSSRPDQELTLPASVNVPAGAEEVTFLVSAIQDSLADASQTVTVTATAADYPTSSDSLLVYDDEQATLSFVLPASLQEGAGQVLNQASIRLAAPAAASIVIDLHCSDTTELQLPPSVTIPQGQTSVSIPLTLPEDTIIDGVQTVTLTAFVTNWPLAQSTISITDNEPRTLTLTLPAKKREGAGLIPQAGTVKTSGILAFPISVTLVSMDTSELTLPESVIIPAGSSSAAFSLQLQDDLLTDGDQTVRVTAGAAGFTSGTATMIVTDDEVPALPVSPTPLDGQNPTPPRTNLAWQYDPDSGAEPESYRLYFGTKAIPDQDLGTTTSTGWTLLSPRLDSATTYYWRIVSLKGSTTRSGPVWSFTTPAVGPLHHFIWDDTTPAAVGVGVPFPVRITAVDEYGITLNRYDGRTPLSALLEQPETTTGTGVYPWVFPFATNYHDARTQSIYQPAEIGPAGRLTSLALEVTTPPGQTLKGFTIRLKHTGRTDYPSSGHTWESSGWTTVYAADETLSGYGWTWFAFSAPFDYDGTSNLMVDFSFNNSGYSTDGITRTTITGSEFRTLAFRTDSSYGDPQQWSGNLPNSQSYNGLPNLRFRRASQELSVTPEVSGPYTQASWSEEISIDAPGTAVRLKVVDPDNPNIFALSNPVNVISVGEFDLSPEPLFTGGTSNQLSGPALGPGYEYEIQCASQPDFGDSVSSGYIQEPEHLFTPLTDGKLYHYRGRALLNGALGKWSPVERSTQDATPPAVTFIRTSGGLTSQSSVNLGGAGTDATSGISSLTVNDIVGISADAFVNWSVPSLPLNEGPNTFTIRASDKAVPPNVKQITWIVTRLTAPETDANGNGVSSLLEYAFNSSAATDGKGLPVLAIAKHPDTQKPHLTLSYRRLILNPASLSYTVETSPDLNGWTALTTSFETLSTTPTGDGLTELVRLRINPSIEGQKRRFARVRVETAPATE